MLIPAILAIVILHNLVAAYRRSLEDERSELGEEINLIEHPRYSMKLKLHFDLRFRWAKA